MNAFVLKIIALISMLIDHLGAVIPEVFGFAPHDVNVFRVIGRVAFPIFVYLVADGFRRTQNPGWFLLRLGLFAVISQIPFALAFGYDVSFFNNTNIFYTLFLGGAAITVYEYKSGEDNSFFGTIQDDTRPSSFSTKNVFALFPIAGFVLSAHMVGADYGAAGVLFIFAMYVAKPEWLRLAVMAGFCLWFHRFTIEQILSYGIANIPSVWLAMIPATLVSVVLIAFYNGKRGANLKWLFYVFYPAHLAALAWL